MDGKADEVVLNETLARLLWPDGKAVGGRLAGPDGPQRDGDAPADRRQRRRVARVGGAVGAGVAAGLLLALVTGQALRRHPYGLGPSDPLAYAAAIADGAATNSGAICTRFHARASAGTGTLTVCDESAYAPPRRTSMNAPFLRRPQRSPGRSSVYATTALALFVGGFAIVAAAPQAPTPAPAPGVIALSVDAGKPGAKIDRQLFGQFAEHLGKGIYEGIWVGPGSPIPNTRGIRNDVVAALKALKVPNVRWPGGCFADEYHWRKGVGPAATRPVTLNPNWGGVTEPNTFGTHEFLDFVDQIGSAAYLSINVGSGTPQEAAEWLEYLTAPTTTALGKERAANGHPEPYAIGYLGIGNESWDCGGNMSAEYYLSQLRVYSRFVRNFNPAQRGAGRMLKIAVGPGGGGPRDADWTDTIMKSWKGRQWSWDHMDGLSLHNYTVVRFPASYKSVGFGEKEYAEILQATLEMDGLIAKYGAIMDKYDPEKKVALAVDEWGSWYAQLPGTTPGFLAQQNSVRDAIIAALNINIFARHADRVRMANIAQMINVLQAMIFTDGPKMVLTPTYHVFKMYVPFQDATSVPVSFDAGRYTHGAITLPRVDAIAAKDASGTLWLALTNVDPSTPAEIATTLTGFTPRSATGETLTAPAVDSVNTFEAPNAVAPKPAVVKIDGTRLTMTLAPKSVTVIAVRP